MSHYTVLVIDSNGSDTVDEQLERFSEHIEMDPYVSGPADLKTMRNYYAQNDDPKIKHWSNEKLVKEFGEDWNGTGFQKDEDGNWVEMSTYNPDSKWDWYVIGGRWKGMLVAKDVALAVAGESGAFGNDARIDGGVDQTTKANLDWEAMRDPKTYENASRFWELFVEGDTPTNDEEEEMLKFVFYKKEYYIERYKDKANYAMCQTEFSTYAVLMDGEWIAPGDMGWFGMSSAELDDELEFQLKFKETFIDPLPDHALITVVDCHI